METQVVTLDRKKALELYRAYKTHAHYSTPIDHEIQRAYQLIAQGKMVIKALESIGAAGVYASGWPKLAIMRADQEQCYFDPEYGGGAGTFQNKRWSRGPASLNLRVAIPGVPTRVI